MKIISHELSFTLSVRELEIWMAALRQASRSSTVPVIPWDSCPFLKQHLELVNLTGWGGGDHEELHIFLRKKASA